MICRAIIVLFLFFTTGYRSLQAQHFSRYNCFSYGVNEGLLQSTINDLEFDINNYWWLSYPSGIQRYDGKNFVYIPVQEGLPENKYCRFFKCRDGVLLISHYQGISRYNDRTNTFKLVYRFPEPLANSPALIGESDGIVYYYTENAEIIGIRTGSFELASIHPTGFPDYRKDFTFLPKISDNIIDGQVALIVNKKIYKWDLKKGSLLFESAAFPDISPYFLAQLSRNEILFYSYHPKGTLQILDCAIKLVRQIPLQGLSNTQLGRCATLKWQNKMLLSVNDRVYETDSSFRQFKFEMVNYQNEPPGANATIHHLKEDNFGNLFLMTVTGGIRKIVASNYPLNYYSTGIKGKNFILSLLPDKEQNRVLAGVVGNGLMVFDTSRQLVRHITMPAGTGNIPVPNAILKSPTGEYYFFANSSKTAWKLSADLTKLTPLPFITSLPTEKSGVGYFCRVLYQDKEKAVVLSETEIYRIDFAAGKVYQYPSANGYIMSGVYCKPYFMMHYNDEFVFLHEEDFRIVKRIPFKNTGGVRCYLHDGSGKIYAGSNKGIFLTDTSGTVLQQLTKESGLPDECIYAMEFDNEGGIWCSSNKGIFKITEGKVVQHFMKQDGLQENEFNTNVVARAYDGELFFGGVNGFNSFFPAKMQAAKDNIQLLMTGILVNNEKINQDTADWGISSLRLPYNRNALSFDFAAMGIHNPDQYIYQYRMDGVDNQWILNSNMQTVRYSLAPGNYTFNIYASRSFDKQAKPMKSIRIVILPPFWKTWWFLGALGLLLLVLTSFGINQQIQKKFSKKLQQLENERQIKLERERISKDLHDSLGAYANAVLYNIELLEKEGTDRKKNELIGELKFASKDIITSLRETVWAFKKEQYSAEECLLRIRNFIQPLTRYYQQIHFHIGGTAPDHMNLHYTKALSVVRIVQEAVTNGIKHANPSAIHINSQTTNDNKWNIVVQDDGTGFNPADLKESEKGNGLNNMEHRAAEAGIMLSVHSDPQKGTIINLII